MEQETRKWTTLCVHKDTLQSLKDSKPYDSMTHDEWLKELLDRHASQD